MSNSKKILPILCTILVLNINLQSEESKIMAKEIISNENLYLVRELYIK